MRTPEDALRERAEFLAEASELVEQLAGELTFLESAQRQGVSQPENLRAIFRLAHSLKGIAALFGARALTRLAHALEDLLDALRFERTALTREVLDRLAMAVDLAARVIEDPDATDAAAVDRCVRALRPPTPTGPPAAQDPRAWPGGYALDPALLAVLTEYEEHRLQSHLTRGTALHRICVRAPLATLDRTLEDLRVRMRPVGEIITFLPGGDGGTDAGVLDVDVLIASQSPVESLRGLVRDEGWEVQTIPRRMPPEIDAGAGAKDPARERPRTEAPRAGSPTINPAETVGAGRTPVGGHSVRVDVARLERLMELVVGLGQTHRALEDLALKPAASGPTSEGTLRLAEELGRTVEGLRTALIEAREASMGPLLDRLAREAQRLARVQGKALRVDVTGAETRIDKVLVDALLVPLLHLVRNAVDHGIETAEWRRERGKAPVGTLAIRFRRGRDHALIEIEDDGAGVPTGVVGDGARPRRAPRDPRPINAATGTLALISTPGFSTRPVITETSGRGVGLDVVQASLDRLGGILELASEGGAFTRFTITLPLTLARAPFVIVRAADRWYGLPAAAVKRTLRLRAAAIHRLGDRSVALHAEGILAVCDLARSDPPQGDASLAEGPWRYIVALGHQGREAGVVVDAIEGSRELVLRPMDDRGADRPGASGLLDLGERGIGLALDPAGLIDEALGALRDEGC